jgi:hypothetical protein
MKTAMQELIVHLEMLKSRVDMADIDSLIEYATTSLEKEKEQIIQPVDRLCDFYGHPHIGEQMYNTRYTTPILKPINK